MIVRLVLDNLYLFSGRLAPDLKLCPSQLSCEPLTPLNKLLFLPMLHFSDWSKRRTDGFIGWASKGTSTCVLTPKQLHLPQVVSDSPFTQYFILHTQPHLGGVCRALSRVLGKELLSSGLLNQEFSTVYLSPTPDQYEIRAITAMMWMESDWDWRGGEGAAIWENWGEWEHPVDECVWKSWEPNLIYCSLPLTLSLQFQQH